MCIKGGYKAVTPVQIANCLTALNGRAISYRAVRVYFACLAIVAFREAAKRDSKVKGRRARDSVRYRISEMSAVTGLKNEAIKKELKTLRGASLLSWSEGAVAFNLRPLPESEGVLASLSGKRSPYRPVPIPRAVLRFVAGSKKPSLAKSALAYAVRGLSIDRKDAAIRFAGTVKASWVAGVFGLSLRSAKGARKALILSGLITKDTASFQRKLNRDGAYFRFNCSWVGRKRFAPLAAKNRVIFAPPYKDKKTSYEFKNQKTEAEALKRSGVCKANVSRREGEPTLKDVKREDLKSFPRLRLLFEQAIKARWLIGSESDLLNWTAAAVRSNTVAARDPVRVFISIVREGRWQLITQAQEDRARAAIRHYREREHENVPRFSRND